jgi:hypothetical protein
VAVGVVVAGAAAAATWFFLPSSKYTARMLLRVPPGSTFLFPTREQVPPLADHQRTQMAYVKSRLVLGQALKELEGKDLETIRLHPNTIEWLEKEVQADFSVAPEVLKIAVSGYNKDDLRQIVEAIFTAYKKEVLDLQKLERENRLTELKKLLDQHEARLKEKKREQQKSMEEEQIGPDAAAGQMGQGYLRMQLDRATRDLVDIQASLRRDRAERNVDEGTLKGLATMFPVSDAEVDAELATDPDIRAAQSQVNRTRDRIEKAAAASKPGEPDPGLVALRKQLADDQAALAAVRKRLATDAAERIRDQHRKAAAEAVRRLQQRMAVNEEIEKVVLAELDKLQDRFKKRNQAILRLDQDKEDTSQLEENTKRIAAEESALRIELTVPVAERRKIVLEEPVVERTFDVRRLVMATVGTFAATFALVLLVFVLAGVRVGTIDSSDDE